MDDKIPIRTVTRAVTVLRAINRHGSMNMMSIARASGLSYPTAYRLVQTLIYEGLIEREPSRKYYRPTALVQELSVGYRPHNQLVAIARPYLEKMTQSMGWPVSIASPVGMNMVLRDSTHAQTTLTFEHYPPGFTFPLVESASGHLCLALSSDEVFEEIVHWLQENEGSEDALAHLPSDAALARIRERGYAVKAWGRYNLTPGRTSAISVPIFRRGTFEAALTLIFFASAMSQDVAIERYLQELQDNATAISDAVSWPAA
ncbi:IclR family transcriptional regulator [Novosphingobium sp. PC22D]|uniref:helix-turn-helix domain-containing protein n=1 Tax=Novosphingobium sp. PC22D TaxID=1962403 RepID=UPI000BF21646|nr:helix-turn-helix domain-containing protein [Novosphingobium sp. PC22D]PEQ11354.1 IclR family transcriptional regulator [Novosphingobium sp. PC22D]